MGTQRRAVSVRPIGACLRPDRESPPPRCAIVVALLGIGCLLGWLGGSIGTGPQQVASTAALTSISETPPNDSIAVDWEEAVTVPPIGPNWELADHSNPAELGGQIYMVMRLRQPSGGEDLLELWRSGDGLRWVSQPLDLAVPVRAPRLTAAADTLLLSASNGQNDELWRSSPHPGSDAVMWHSVPLRVPEGISGQSLTAAATSEGEASAVMVGDLDIWQDILTPFLPDGINLEDGQWRYEGDEFLYATDDCADIRLFAEHPEVVVADDRVWVRLVTLDGEEVLQTVPLPPETHPITESPLLTEIQLFAAWVLSDDGALQAVPGRNMPPAGQFQPTTWGNGFVAAVHQLDRMTGTSESALWRSDTGQVWLPDPVPPPAECAPFVVATSGDNLHLTSAAGTQCRRDFDSDWVVLEQPCAVCYKLGGTAGFLGYPKNFEYDKGMLSRDGISWSAITVPGSEAYPTLAVLENRLVAVSVCKQPSQVRIWLGTIF
ncbi:MAG: hypothetical protein QNL12_10710 [Acidimicrobiia bacterium]|nr:hypothetical protein [Acidimicrobiia bacterium]